MIKLEMIAEQIESILNASVLNEISKGNTVLDNGRVTYRFRVVFDSGDYVDSDYLVQGMQPEETGAISLEQTNRIVRYINCELTSPESNSQGVIKADFAFNTYLEILVPLVNAGRKAKKLELVTSIRQCIDSAFSLNSLGTMTDEEEANYTYGVNYSLSNTGARELRAEIGDSITLSASITYFFIQDGVNSADIRLYDRFGEQIPYTRLGLNRTAIQESNVPSDTTDGAGKATNISTVFGLNFDMPMRSGGIGSFMSERVLNYITEPGIYNSPMEITVKWYKGENVMVEKTFSLLFNEANLNAETTLNVSVSVSMVEALK